MPMYFVVYCEKNYSWDTSLERGTESFLTKEGALSFIKVWENKGYICHLFEGNKIYLPTPKIGNDAV